MPTQVIYLPQPTIRLVHKETRRHLRDSQAICKKQQGESVVYFYPECAWMVEKWQTLIDHSSVVKRSSKREIFRFQNSLCIKQIHQSWRKKVLHLFFKNQAERYWYNVHALLYLRMPVPKPYVLINTKNSSLLILEQVEGAILCDFVLSVNQELRQKFIRQFAYFVGRLHFSEGIYHRDLTAENILVRQEGEHFHFVLLDLDRVKYYSGEVPESKRVKNLSQLNVYICSEIKLTDGLRFLNYYNSLNPSPENLKKLFFNIVQQTRKRKPREKNHILL